MMRNNSFLDWERVIVANGNENIIGYCTFTEKDELPDTYEYTPFIGFMFVDENYRRKRISEQMIKKGAEYAKELNYMLCSQWAESVANNDRPYLIKWIEEHTGDAGESGVGRTDYVIHNEAR